MSLILNEGRAPNHRRAPHLVHDKLVRRHWFHTGPSPQNYCSSRLKVLVEYELS